MGETKLIPIRTTVLSALKEIKHPGQTYSDLILQLVKLFRKLKFGGSEFINEIQKQKMKELWDNPEDEAWDNA